MVSCNNDNHNMDSTPNCGRNSTSNNNNSSGGRRNGTNEVPLIPPTQGLGSNSIGTGTTSLYDLLAAANSSLVNTNAVLRRHTGLLRPLPYLFPDRSPVDASLRNMSLVDRLNQALEIVDDFESEDDNTSSNDNDSNNTGVAAAHRASLSRLQGHSCNRNQGRNSRNNNDNNGNDDGNGNGGTAAQ